MPDVCDLEARLEAAREALVLAMAAQRKAQQKYYFTARALDEARKALGPDG